MLVLRHADANGAANTGNAGNVDPTGNDKTPDDNTDPDAGDDDPDDDIDDLINGDDDAETVKDAKAVLAKNRQLRRKLKAQGDKLAQVERDKQAARDKTNRENDNWKEVAEDAKKRADAAEARIAEFDGVVEDTKKISAVKKLLGVQVAEKYNHLIDLEGIEIDDDTGRPDKAMVAKAAKKFKNEWPEAISAAKKPAGIPPNAPGDSGDGTPSYENWLKMAPADKKKHYSAVMKATEATGT